MSINSTDDITFSDDTTFNEVVSPFEDIPDVAQVIDTQKDFNNLLTSVESTTDMIDAGHQLASESSVCRYAAEFISDIFGKNILGRLSLESFTTMPTRTNYIYLKKQLDQRLANEQASTVLAASTFFSKTLMEVQRILHKLTEVSEEHMTMCNNIRQSMVPYSPSSTSLVVGDVGGRPANIVDVPIKNYSFNAIADSNSGISADPVMGVLHQKLQELVQYKHIAAICYMVVTGQSLQSVIENSEIKATAQTYQVSLKDLFQFGLNANIRTLYANTLPEYAASLSATMESLVCTKDISTFDQASIEMANKEKSIDKSLHYAKEVMAFMYYGVVFMKTLDTYLEGMLKYTHK